MRKLLWFVVLLVVLLTGAMWALRLSPTALWENVTIGAAMAAKLGCSARYLTGLDPEQIQADLGSYSAALEAFDLRYDDGSKTARAALFGAASTQARFRPGLGCTLELGDTTALDAVTVPTVRSSVDLWPRGTAAPSPNPSLEAALAAVLKRDNAAGQNTRALLAVVDGSLAAEQYASGFDAATMHLGWSMGKSVIAILLGHLADRGELSMDEDQLFPAWAEDARGQLRVDQLLTMTSGLDFDEVYAPGSDATRMLFASYSAADVALASSPLHEPGRHFSYSSGTTNLLTRLAMQRLGGLQATLDRLHGQIFSPLAMTRTVLEPDPSGEFVGSSYVFASARDWARLGQLLLNGGTLNGHRVLSEDWVAHATSPNESDNEPRYGYQLWLNDGGYRLRWPDLPADAFAMQGNRAQVVMMIPSARTVLVRLGWSAGSYPINDNFAAVLEASALAKARAPIDRPPEEAAL